MPNYSGSIDEPGDGEESMEMTDAQKVAVILESDLIDSFSPKQVFDILSCKDMLRKAGHDSLLYEDPETVLDLVKWKRDDAP